MKMKKIITKLIIESYSFKILSLNYYIIIDSLFTIFLFTLLIIGIDSNTNHTQLNHPATSSQPTNHKFGQSSHCTDM